MKIGIPVMYFLNVGWKEGQCIVFQGPGKVLPHHQESRRSSYCKVASTHVSAFVPDKCIDKHT